MRIVGAPLPAAASVCTRRAKIGFGRCRRGSSAPTSTPSRSPRTTRGIGAPADVADRAARDRACRRGRLGRRLAGRRLAGRHRDQRRARRCPSSAIARYVAKATGVGRDCQLPSVPVGDRRERLPAASRRRRCGAGPSRCARRRGAPGPRRRCRRSRPRSGRRSARGRASARRRRRAGPTASPCTCARPATRLVLPEVLRQQHDARVAPGDVRRLLEVAVLGAGRDAAELVGRVGLVAVLVEPQAERRRRALQAAAALELVEQALDLLQARRGRRCQGSRRAGSARGACCAGGRRSRRRARAGTRGRRRCATACRLPSTQPEPAQELAAGACSRSLVLRSPPAGASAPISTVAHRVGRVDRRVRGEDHRAIDVRRDRACSASRRSRPAAASTPAGWARSRGCTGRPRSP